jgi:hypothetical protein
MKSLTNFTFGMLAIAVIGFTACETDPCEGVDCPSGYICDEGNCIETDVTYENEIVTGHITEDVSWTSDRIWELDGKVIVDNGVTLTIEPGSIIKGQEGTETQASALIVARGGKINACGTAEKPIIFTSVLDDIELGQKTGSNLTQIDNEKWGGLIILGKAPVSTGDGDTEGQIEGIPANEPYGKYGGDDPSDDSGSLCYVSIRHGGVLIGDGNEINGLTLGGVGNGTTINHVEVVSNLDDGIECFGGTVDISNVIVAFQGDDALDIDQNYSGTISNFYVIHGGDTDEGMEIDGPEGSTYTTGKFTLRNGTIWTNDGSGSAADLKSKAQGTIENVSFAGYSTFVKVSASFNDDCSVKTDAYDTAIEGDLRVQNCEFVSASDMYSVYTKAEDCWSAVSDAYNTNLDDAWSGNGNSSPASASIGADLSQLSGWSWTDEKGLLQ